MRKITLLILLLPVFQSCSKDPAITGKEVRILFQSMTIGEKTANAIPFTHLHLFIIDRDNTIVRHEAYTRNNLDQNGLNITLPFGRYRLACIANTPGENDIAFKTGEPLANVLLYLSRKENGEQEANDILTAFQSISISENNSTIPTIHLSRRVAMLDIMLGNITEDARDLKMEVLFVPSAIPFIGSGTNTFGSIIKKITLQEKNQGRVQLFTFPTRKGEANLTVTYREGNKTKRKIIGFQEAIDTNKIIRINADFTELPEGGLQGNGENLLENGDFEYWSNPSREPDHWRFYKDGKDSSIVKIAGTPVLSGKQSVFLQGKTYLYQDIPVIPGKRYEIKMHVNSPTASFTWKYYCYWRKTAGTALPSEYNKPIQAPNYLKQTEGWTNVFKGKTFLAPEGTKLLRVEIRTYGKEIRPGEGLYIDNFHVELVE